ncbi:hypothetical protein PTR01_20850 [Serratia bockelmannii]|uniref:hypothetical protein n=1 Tax=Serratia bockelmannii TaxID=2703793 RepID=UPI00313E4647
MNNEERGESMKRTLRRDDRQWWGGVVVLLPMAVLGGLLLYAMTFDGVLGLLQDAMR